MPGRGWVLTMGLLLGAGAAGAAAQSETGMVAPGQQTVLLWPNGAPGALGTAMGDRPDLTVFLPKSGATGTGVVIAPGGGYEQLAMGHEGFEEAEWLAARGVAAFVLRYRLGPKYRYPVEQNDAKRAMRLVRSRAAEFGIRPDRLGMMGFSAGGHLAATTGTILDDGRGDDGQAGSADVVERQGSRPDFLVLGYPVISMEDGVTHGGSQRNLLGPGATEEQKRMLSADQRVTARTPPTFLFSTTDDAVVPVENSVLFYQALAKAGVPAEMHLFRHGQHGFGMGQAAHGGNAEVQAWPELMWRWMQGLGLVPAEGGAK